jgi:pyruvate/2-oxoglutarate dehydrogenase complex dihydrolipoamide acyltransferase (E2) component
LFVFLLHLHYQEAWKQQTMSYPFEERNTPSNRTLVIDAGALASKRHIIYGFFQADVTKARTLIHAESSKRISFTAYIIACLARAVADNPSVQAYRKGRNKLVIFQDVDVMVMVESEANATAIPHIIRQANAKSVFQISEEIHAVKNNTQSSHQSYDKKAIQMFARFPEWLRMLIYRQFRRNPQTLRNKQGTVILTSVGMMGGRRGRGGWGLTFLPMHTLGVTLGGIERKPTVVGPDDEIAVRDCLCITVAVDHDVVDGAPAARFASKFIDIIEAASLLQQPQCEEAKQEN